MPAETRTLLLPDSRTLAWCEYGDPNSKYPPIIYLHGSPSSRFEGSLYDAAALSLNMRIISPDRPGMGLSTPCPGRTFLSYPADILALVDYLKIQKFNIIGSSGGCPYTLACLKSIPPERLLKAQVVSGVYPPKLGMEGTRFIQKALVWVSYYSPSTTGTLIDWTFGRAARSPDPTALSNLISDHAKTMPVRDKAAYSQPGFLENIVDASRGAFVQGGDGAAVEFGLWARDWGFELQDVDADRLTIWHGREDGNIGCKSAEKAAGCLKGVKTRFLEGEGHNISAFYTDEILEGFLKE